MDLTLLDKLRQLNLDSEVRQEIKMRPMNRYYFVLSTHPGEQFFVFASVAAWLFRKLEVDFPQPLEDDDPNALVATILEEIRKKGVSMDLAPQKLKLGYGDQVCSILSYLADQALLATNFKWQKPTVLEDELEEVDDPEQVEDESEVMLDEVEDELDPDSEESFRDGYVESDEDNKLASRVNIEEWAAERERASGALRVRVAPDARDWRARAVQMRALIDEVSTRGKSCLQASGRVRTRASRCVTEAGTREHALAARLDTQAKEYAAARDELTRAEQEYKAVSGGVTDRQEILNDLNSKVDIIKQKTESKGSSLGSASPAAAARRAAERLRREVQELDMALAAPLWAVSNVANYV